MIHRSRRCFKPLLLGEVTLVGFYVCVARVVNFWLLGLLQQDRVGCILIEILEVQSIVHLVFDLDGLAETKIVMSFFKRIEVDVFVVFDERSVCAGGFLVGRCILTFGRE